MDLKGSREKTNEEGRNKRVRQWRKNIERRERDREEIKVNQQVDLILRLEFEWRWNALPPSNDESNRKKQFVNQGALEQRRQLDAA